MHTKNNSQNLLAWFPKPGFCDQETRGLAAHYYKTIKTMKYIWMLQKNENQKYKFFQKEN